MMGRNAKELIERAKELGMIVLDVVQYAGCICGETYPEVLVQAPDGQRVMFRDHKCDEAIIDRIEAHRHSHDNLGVQVGRTFSDRLKEARRLLGETKD